MKDFLLSTIQTAGHMAKEYFERGVSAETKSGPRDLVTEADLAVNAFLTDTIHTAYPDHHIKTEESDTEINTGADYEWVIDPIDGTSNFAKRIPFWGVMIAVLHHGETILSAVYFPIVNELFYAEKGKGAYLNGRQIRVSAVSSFGAARGHIFRAIPTEQYGTHIERYRHANAKAILATDLSFRQLGCSAVLVYVAAGTIDFAFGNAGLDWDYLPTFFICQEAGAVATDSDGNPWQRGRQDYVIGNPDIHPKVMELFAYE